MNRFYSFPMYLSLYDDRSLCKLPGNFSSRSYNSSFYIYTESPTFFANGEAGPSFSHEDAGNLLLTPTTQHQLNRQSA
jgi:hypothetical protein